MFLTYYKNIQQTQILNYNDLCNSNITHIIPAYKKITVYMPHAGYLGIPNTKTQEIQEKFDKLIDYLEPFLKEFNINEMYSTFQIPKKTGGLRTINAPNTHLKNILTIIKNVLEEQIKCLPHSAAHAYIPHLSTQTALKQHQQNKSQYFLKLDLKDFFNSCTEEIFVKNISELYPFCLFTDIKEKLKKLFKVCSLNGSLPQGSPVSPYLSNLIMVPIDYAITLICNKKNLVYTRYADDLLISGTQHFDWKAIEMLISKIIPFKINKEKTRYGRRSGRNWNLGLMLNKDNNITIGHKKKRLLKAKLNNFIHTHETTCYEEAAQLLGELSYLGQIEPEYYNYIIRKFNLKYNIDTLQLLKNKL